MGNFERGATTGLDADDGEVRLTGAMDLENPTKAGVLPDFTPGCPDRRLENLWRFLQ